MKNICNSLSVFKRLNGIKSSAAVQGLYHVQQVVVTEDNTDSARLSRNRLFHSEEVIFGTKAILDSISIPGKNMDYKGAAEIVALLHDLGHPPGGHKGVDLIKKKFLTSGYNIEMDDNNQTFEVIKKHRLVSK
jgi:dGTP triphosphohydrolase